MRRSGVCMVIDVIGRYTILLPAGPQRRCHLLLSVSSSAQAPSLGVCPLLIVLPLPLALLTRHPPAHHHLAMPFDSRDSGGTLLTRRRATYVAAGCICQQ